MANLNNRSLLIAVGVAGVAMAVLSNIPFVACVNCLLCGWIWGGGIFSVWFYRRLEGSTQGGAEPTLNTNQGLIIGALAGLVAGVLGAILNLVIGAGATAALSSMQQFSSNNELAKQLAAQGANSAISFVVMIVLFPAFGALGGFLATNFIFKPKVTTPPAV